MIGFASSPRIAFPAAGSRRVAALLLCAVLAGGGCRDDAPRVANRSVGARQSSSEHLSRSLHFVNRMDEFEKPQAILQATYHLNRWMESQSLPEQWQADPLVQTLPRQVRQEAWYQALDSKQFTTDDVELLLESVWMRDLSQWLASQEVPSPLSKALARQAESLPSDQGDQLTIAYRLFDWVVRHIQLDPLLEYPADAVTIGTAETAARRPPPMRAEAGPGYMYTPGQTLVFGHGDALNRARVFVLLARQQGIPVVMLGFPGQTTPPRPRPWLPAALIGERLYLFDTQLGLPLPGPDGAAIATLDQARENPELLSALDVGGEFQYRVNAAELKEILALIEAAPSALTLRMEVLEKALLGDERVVLTVHPSQLADRLQAHQGIADVLLWALPVETRWFAQEIQQRIQRDERAASQYFLTYGIYESRNSLTQARYKHFRGEFENQGDEEGAKTLYAQSRVPNRQLEQIESSRDVQSSLGLRREDDERDQVWQNRVALTRNMIEQTKANASYWLGLAHFDTGRYEAAQEWFRTRTLEASPEGTWSDGAAYNLARTYEALGEIEKARDLYLRDDSPQQHGNVLRARLLRTLPPRTETGG